MRVCVVDTTGARGLDFPELQLVILYDVPKLPEEYLHRIGRTGRANKNGVAITIVGKKEAQYVHEIKQFLSGANIRIPGLLTPHARSLIDSGQ